MKTFRDRLKKAREAAGWNQKELAEKAGLNPSSIRHYEQGFRNPSLQVVFLLADALGVSLDWLTGRTDT